jgi:hypothetical protein
MNFSPDLIPLILCGKKTQTRRPCQNKDYPVYGRTALSWLGVKEPPILRVVRGKRTMWRVGQDYAVCPGRGKRQVARIKIAKIRCEPLDAITDDDAMREGVQRGSYPFSGIPYCYMDIKGIRATGDTPREAFAQAWALLYPASDLTELVWVLEFEVTP